MVNRAVVMSGGGSKGAFQLGALDYLVNEKGLDFQVIAGVSTGSLNAVTIAQGRDREGLRDHLGKLRDIWMNIRSYKDVYRKGLLGGILRLLFKKGLYDPGPLRETIARHVSLERLRESGRQLRVGAVCLETGQYKEADQNDPLVREWTLASSSLPLLFPPVRVGAETVVDGGIRNLTPLEGAFRALKGLGHGGGPEEGCDEMYVLLASPLEVGEAETPIHSALDIGRRAVAILMNEVLREDLAYAVAINNSVRAYEAAREQLSGSLGAERATALLDDLPFEYRPPKYRYVRMRAVVPEREFSGALEFDPAKILEAFAAGRRAARSPLSEDDLERKLDRSRTRVPS